MVVMREGCEGAEPVVVMREGCEGVEPVGVMRAVSTCCF